MNLLNDSRLQERLAQLRQNCPVDYLALWFRIGSELTLDEMSALDWSHIEDDGEQWKIEGPIGLRGMEVEALVLAPAVAALTPYREKSGPVFPHNAWKKNLCYLRTTSGIDCDALRKELAPPAANRKPRRFTPRGPSKKNLPADPIAENTSPTDPEVTAAVEETVLTGEQIEKLRAEMRERIALEAEQLENVEPDEPTPARGRRKPKAEDPAWTFKPGQAYVSVAEAAKFLGVCSKTIKRMNVDGDIRMIVISGTLHRVEVASLREYAERAAIWRKVSISRHGKAH